MSSTNSKKNKRGARGSTEEELTVSKRPNMESDNERTEEEVEETAFRRELVGKANPRKEELSLLGVWTIDGKVFVKTSPEGRPVRIYSEHDLNNL